MNSGPLRVKKLKRNGNLTGQTGYSLFNEFGDAIIQVLVIGVMQ
jgi:hypothetical protein